MVNLVQYIGEGEEEFRFCSYVEKPEIELEKEQEEKLEKMLGIDGAILSKP